jgi:hypothetical protein
MSTWLNAGEDLALSVFASRLMIDLSLMSRSRGEVDSLYPPAARIAVSFILDSVSRFGISTAGSYYTKNFITETILLGFLASTHLHLSLGF